MKFWRWVERLFEIFRKWQIIKLNCFFFVNFLNSIYTLLNFAFVWFSDLFLKYRLREWIQNDYNIISNFLLSGESQWIASVSRKKNHAKAIAKSSFRFKINFINDSLIMNEAILAFKKSFPIQKKTSKWHPKC